MSLQYLDSINPLLIEKTIIFILLSSYHPPQYLHRIEVAITRGAEGKFGRTFVGNLNEEKSLELASKIAGEGFVFTVSCLHGCRSLDPK